MPTSDPEVRPDAGGWLSGPCLNPDELPQREPGASQHRPGPTTERSMLTRDAINWNRERISPIGDCQHCGKRIMLVGSVWYRTEIADINGFCPDSPDDQHRPAVARGH